MRNSRLSIGRMVVLAIFALATLMSATGTAGQEEKVLHSFGGNRTDGHLPYGGLIFDTADNLYGATFDGGTNNVGMVFELVPQSDGSWTEKVLHSFVQNGSDGYAPSAGLILDASGNLYGTTSYGGAYNQGTVFELAPHAGGGWSGKILHSFNGTDSGGDFPTASLIFDTVGNLYGTTVFGGSGANCGGAGCGAVYELTPKPGGVWVEKTLHAFSNSGTDGSNPEGNLFLDSSGNLYGTTYYGGAYGYGAVFKLTPGKNGNWAVSTLHSFNADGADGEFPQAGLISDPSGNLYGTTFFGGAFGGGTAFELTSGGTGSWSESVLHSFAFNGDGAYPEWGALVFDGAGDLFGTTSAGGAYNGGTVFELTPTGAGTFTEMVLHSFSGSGRDGTLPFAGLTMDASGNLYGTSRFGGAYGRANGGNGYGTVFEVTP